MGEHPSHRHSIQVHYWCSMKMLYHRRQAQAAISGLVEHRPVSARHHQREGKSQGDVGAVSSTMVGKIRRYFGIVRYAP